METTFTPVSAAIGGVLIGLGGLCLYLFLGRIAGISGIVAGAMQQAEGRNWRLAFIIGLLLGPTAVYWLDPSLSFHTPNLSVVVVLAGLLVGLGTRWGSGCTSGHGVCGVSRMSPRSIVATVLFMLVGVLVASLINSGVQYA